MDVYLEKKPIGKFNVFDLEDPRLEEWMKDVKKIQKSHYFDNNNTKSFQYSDTEFDVIQLRVCQILFGLRLSDHNGNGLPKGTASSMLKSYTWQERQTARKLQVKIVKFGKTKEGNIKMNVVFVSAVFKKDDGDFEPSEIRVFTLGEGDDIHYLDAAGRIYISWEGYLTENELPKGLMIYPKDGNYTPKTGEVVILNIRETPSCKLTAQAKEYLDKAATIGGLLLVGATLVPMAPMAAFSVATMEIVSTGSFYVGTAITAYSTFSGTYDLINKVKHDESARAETIMLATIAFSKFSQWYTKRWAEILADSVGKKELWSEVSKEITKTQKMLFVMNNLIQIGLSASSVLTAMWNLWMKKDRSWSDWRNLAVSCFFFANVIVKPITLQALFESEQGKYIQQQFGSKVTTSESKQEYEKAVENAKTTEQKTYLTRNLEKIEDLDEHFYQVHETGAIIDYTENGLVINNVTTVTPEAYNQTLNNYYQRRLNEIKLLPTEKQRSSAIKDLTKNVDKNTQKLAQKYVNDNLTVEQQKEFNQKLTEISKQRKNKLFGDSSRTKLIHMPNNFMENNETILHSFEKILNDPNKIMQNPQEIWKFCKFIWNNPRIILECPQMILKLIEKIIKNREIISNFVCMIFKQSDFGKISGIIEEIMNNSKIILEFFQEIMKNGDVILNAVKSNLNWKAILLIFGLIVKYRETMQKIYKKIKKNPMMIFEIVNEIKSIPLSENPENFWQNVEILLKRLESLFYGNSKEFSDDDEIFEHSERKNNFPNKNSDVEIEERRELETLKPTFEETIEKSNEKEISETVYKFHEMLENSRRSTTVENQFLIRQIPFETVKFEIEQAFEVMDYSDVRVGGQQIFKNLTTGDANRLYQIINTLPADPTLKTKYFEIACKIVNDPKCRLKAESPRQFADILEIVRKSVEKQQTIKNLPQNQLKSEELFLSAVLSNNGLAYPTIQKETNQIYDSVVSTTLTEHQLGILTVEADVGHTINHKTDDMSESEFLAVHAKEIFQETGIFDFEHPPKNQSINEFCGAHLHKRKTFGSTVTHGDSTDPANVYSREDTSFAPDFVYDSEEMSDQIGSRIKWMKKLVKK